MPKNVLLIFSLVLLSYFSIFAQKTRCGAHPNPSEIKGSQAIENFTQKWISENQNSLSNRELITISVVVHVLWNQPEQNITDEQIQSQIDILNEDFRALNTEIQDIPNEFKNHLADIEIEFCLAKVDPQGNPTNGITRTFTQAPAILGSQSIHYSSQGGADAWDSEKYLNIWVANGTSIAGFGSFPGEDIPEEDGVEIAYENFGNIAVEPPYHLGRTTTHEIGHYFNLCHVWGDDCEDDKVSDTPISSKSYLGKCPVHPSSSCGTNDMFMNFMYWTDDECMGMFTEGQKMRMLATLNGPRAGLLNSSNCVEVNTKSSQKDLSIRIYPNPNSGIINFDLENDLELSDVNFQIINQLGVVKEVKLNNPNSHPNINISTLEDGLYFLKISQEDKFIIKKIILAK